jgi:hypothetical protein
MRTRKQCLGIALADEDSHRSNDLTRSERGLGLLADDKQLRILSAFIVRLGFGSASPTQSIIIIDAH